MKRVKISEQINFIGCWNIENENLCDSVVKFFEDRKELQYPGVTGYGKDDSAKKSTDISIEPKNLNLSEYQILKEYMSELYKCYCDYKNQWPFLKETIKTVDIPRFNIQKYQPGGHYAKIHSERSTTQSMHRIFAWMTYLNNVDEGGFTNFTHYGLKIKPEKGKTLIWPSEWTHAHTGEVLKKGLKYIITGWMHFPFFFKG